MSDGAPAGVPLVVDLDDTLLRSDLLLECFWKGMGVAPIDTLRIVLRNWRDRPALKAALAARFAPDVARVPRDPAVEAAIREAAAAGREVVVASGSSRELAEAVAAAVGDIDVVYGTEGRINLTAANKAALLTERYGKGGFDYIGDSAKDIPVWRAARRAIVARPAARFRARLAAEGVAAEPLGAPWSWTDVALALRPHQWVKNVLLFLPLIAAHRLDPAGIALTFAGFVAFSALASSIYIVNDLTDLDADRLHEKKRHRIFASGRLPIKLGMALSLGLGLFGLAVAAALGWASFGVMVLYLITTLAYSMRLKRVRWTDITVLAALYTIRVVAGAAATGVEASGWLIAFVFPVFLTLACVKRLTELAKATTDGYLPGRRYGRADRDDVFNVAILGALASVGIFLAYSASDMAAVLYRSIPVLWLVATALAIWLGRMIYTGWAGRQDYDPILFALTDKIGLALIGLSLALLVLGAS